MSVSRPRQIRRARMRLVESRLWSVSVRWTAQRWLNTGSGSSPQYNVSMATVQARYGTHHRAVNRQTRPGRHRDAASSQRPILLERGKTLLQMVRASGLYDQVEARKQAEFARHIAELRLAIDPASLTHLQEWVTTVVAPRIRVVDRGRRVARPDRSSLGAPGYVVREGGR